MKIAPTVLCLLVILTVSLLGCATKYQPIGLAGGYSNVQIDANTYRVSFQGNARTSRERVETYMLYRCAELTEQAGFDYFVIVSGGTDTRQNVITNPGQYTSTTTGMATGYGNMAHGTATTTGTYTPGTTSVITRYDGTATIKVFKGEKPGENPNAFVAKEVLKHLGPNIER